MIQDGWDGEMDFCGMVGNVSKLSSVLCSLNVLPVLFFRLLNQGWHSL